jgi:hypothetical protein
VAREGRDVLPINTSRTLTLAEKHGFIEHCLIDEFAEYFAPVSRAIRQVCQV